MKRILAIRDFFYEEIAAQKPRLFLWAPVFTAVGIGVYFSLGAEPPAGLVIAVFGLCLGALGFFRNSPLRVPLLLLFLMVSGFAAAQLRTQSVHTAVIIRETGPVQMEGTIALIDDLGAEGARLVLSDLHIEDMTPEQTPRRVRLRVRNDEGLEAGQRISVLGRLHTPSPPAIPGGFDFQRHLYFQGIGAVGFAYKDPQIIAQDGRSVLLHGWSAMRRHVDRAIEAAMPYPEAGVAMALITGRQTALDESTNEAMRVAGLAHMLSISGLHIALFCGVIFFVSRLLMVLIPGMALHHPVKKYAAVLAIFGACFYTLLAGASIPMQRSLVMSGIVFLAIILDRSPISLRLLALAALSIMLLFPESLMGASFQLSFAAVAALIVFFDFLGPYWGKWSKGTGIIRKGALYFAGISLTTIVATVATSPFSVFHFQEFQLYGLIGNFIAVPILGALIMPAVVAVLVMIPILGMGTWLESLAFFFIKHGVTLILKTAHWVETLPYSSIRAEAWPLSALVCMVVGGLWIFLWKGRLRPLGLVPFVVSVFIICQYKQPDIIISSDIELAAVRTEGDELLVSSRRKERFVREQWVQIFGLMEKDVRLWPKEGAEGPMRCDEAACRIDYKGHRVSYVRQAMATVEECGWAEAVISREPVKPRSLCTAPLVIDFFDARYKGAHALWLDGGSIRMENVRDRRGRRPWTDHSFARDAKLSVPPKP